jgi:hypothetical protein
MAEIIFVKSVLLCDFTRYLVNFYTAIQPSSFDSKLSACIFEWKQLNHQAIA